jgi:hypothetical protein
MTEYARAWVAGYGSKLVPRTPFECARLGDTERVVLAHHAETGVMQVMVAPDGKSAAGNRVALGPNTTSMSDVLAFVEEDESGRFEAAWRIATREYECAWPPGFTLWSTDLGVDWAFELAPSDATSDGDAMIYVRGPWRGEAPPALEAFIGDGMRDAGRYRIETARGPCEAIDLAYRHDEIEWWQGRCLAPLDGGATLLVTAQAPRTAAAPVRAAMEALAQGLRVRSP